MEPTKKTPYAVGTLAILLIGGYFAFRSDESTSSTEANAQPAAQKEMAAAPSAPEVAEPVQAAAPEVNTDGTRTEGAAAATGSAQEPTSPSHPEELKKGPSDEPVRVAKSRHRRSRSRREQAAPTAARRVHAAAASAPAQNASAETDEDAARRAATLARLSSKVEALRNETSALDHQVSTFEQEVRHASSSTEARSLNARKDHLAVRADEVEQHAETLESELERARP